MKQYVEADKIKKIVDEKEILSLGQRYNEYVMTSIRTSWGCDAEHIQNVFGEKYYLFFFESIKPFMVDGNVRKENSQYFLTDKGKLFADAIAADLFY